MRLTKSCLLAVGLSCGNLISVPVFGQSTALEPESSLPGLSRLIDEALRMSPQIIIRNAEAAAVEADVAVAKSARLPSVVSSIQWTTGQEDRQYFVGGSQTAEKLAYAVAVAQPLYRWGVISKSIENAEIRKQIDNGNTRLAYLALVRSIRASYLRTIVSRQALERLRLSEKISNERFVQTQDKRKSNQVSEADLINAELARDQATVDRMIGEEAFDRERTMLARVAGTELVPENLISEELPAMDVETVDAILQGLLADFRMADSPTNTAIEAAKHNLRITKNGLHAQRMTLRPNVDLVAGLSQDEQNLTADPASRYKLKYMYAGVRVTWSIFDGFASRNLVRGTMARMRAAEAALKDQQTAVLDRIASASKELQRLGLMVNVEGRRLVSAENYLKYMQEQLSRGQVSEADLEGARLNLYRTRETTYMARYYYWNNLSEVMGLIEADSVLDRLP